MKYKEKLKELLKAIDIAIECTKEHEVDDGEYMISFYYEEKKGIEDSKIKTIASLKYDVQAILTYYQEGSGKDVECFWKKIKKEGLSYKRKSVLTKVLKNRRIKNDIEYQYVIDTMLISLQDDLISKEEYKSLNKFIGEYENK